MIFFYFTLVQQFSAMAKLCQNNCNSSCAPCHWYYQWVKMMVVMMIFRLNLIWFLNFVEFCMIFLILYIGLNDFYVLIFILFLVNWIFCLFINFILKFSDNFFVLLLVKVLLCLLHFKSCLNKCFPNCSAVLTYSK